MGAFSYDSRLAERLRALLLKRLPGYFDTHPGEFVVLTLGEERFFDTNEKLRRHIQIRYPSITYITERIPRTREELEKRLNPSPLSNPI